MRIYSFFFSRGQRRGHRRVCYRLATSASLIHRHTGNAPRGAAYQPVISWSSGLRPNPEKNQHLRLDVALLMARIGLIYDLFEDYPWKPGEPVDADAEYEPPETVDALEQALITLGHSPVRVGTAYDLLRKLDGLRLDAAVNITEAAHSRNREAYEVVLHEMAGIMEGGSDAHTLLLMCGQACSQHRQ